MKQTGNNGALSDVRLDMLQPLLQPWVSDPWGMLRPPVSQEALQMSCRLAAATYDMDIEPWLQAGWQDVTIQVDGDLTTGVDLPDEDSGRLEKLAAKWKMHRVRTRIKQRNPLGQVMDAVRQIRESDTGKAIVMAHEAPGGRYVIAISFMGTGERFYDWFSNFRMSGENGMHKGFYQLAKQFEENEDDIAFPDIAQKLGLEKLTLRHILEEAKHPDSRFLLWLSGHSQGSAVMQIWCREKIREEGVLPNNMIGYGFASPSVMLLGAENYPEAFPLYHVINRDDLFARMGAQLHLGMVLYYTPDAKMKQQCYRWPEDDASAKARAMVSRITAQMRNMPSSLISVVAYLGVLASMSAEDMALGAKLMQVRHQSVRKLLSAADNTMDSVLREISKRAADVYADMTGSPMNARDLAKMTAQIVAAVDVLGMKRYTTAMMELMRFPHSIAGNFEDGMPSYIYIAAHSIQQLQPMLPQHLLTAEDASKLPAVPYATSFVTVNRRRVQSERVERRPRSYSQAHQRSDTRTTHMAVVSASVRHKG